MITLRSVSRLVNRRLSLVSVNQINQSDMPPETQPQSESGETFSPSTRPSPQTLSEENNADDTKVESQPTITAKQPSQPTWEFTENWKPPQEDCEDKLVSRVLKQPHRNIVRTSIRKHRVKVLSPDHIEKKETGQKKSTESELNEPPIDFQTIHQLTNRRVPFPEPLQATIIPIRKKTALSPHLNQGEESTNSMSLKDKTTLSSNEPVQSNEWQQKTISLYQKMSLEALQAMRRAAAVKQQMKSPGTVETQVNTVPVEESVQTTLNVTNEKKEEVEPIEKLKEPLNNEPVELMKSEPQQWLWLEGRRFRCKTIAVDKVKSLDYNRRLWSSINAEVKSPVTRPVINMKKDGQKYQDVYNSITEQLSQQKAVAAKPLKPTDQKNVTSQKNELKLNDKGADKAKEASPTNKSPAQSSGITATIPMEVRRKPPQLNYSDKNEINKEMLRYILHHFTDDPRKRHDCFNPQEYYTPRGKIYNRSTRGEPHRAIKWNSSDPIWDIPKDIWTDLRPFNSDQTSTKLSTVAKSNLDEESPPRIMTKLAALTARGPSQPELRTQC